jgi:hypothetical protein
MSLQRHAASNEATNPFADDVTQQDDEENQAADADASDGDDDLPDFGAYLSTDPGNRSNTSNVEVNIQDTLNSAARDDLTSSTMAALQFPSSFDVHRNQISVAQVLKLLEGQQVLQSEAAVVVEEADESDDEGSSDDTGVTAKGRRNSKFTCVSACHFL